MTTIPAPATATHREDDNRPSVFTGLADLDELTGPLPPGRLVVVGGRPSAGSTAFMLTTALNNALAGHTVAFMTLQVTRDQLRRNVVAALAGVNMDRRETMNAGRLARTRRAARTLDQVDLRVLQGIDISHAADQICHRLKQLSDKHPLGLVLVDDLALAAHRDAVDGQTVRDLAQLARELDAPVLLTAHLRAEAGRNTTLPTVADFHDPHVLAAADAVVLVHRPDRYGNTPGRTDQVDLLAARGWPNTGTASVRFEPEYHRLVDLPNP